MVHVGIYYMVGVYVYGNHTKISVNHKLLEFENCDYIWDITDNFDKNRQIYS